MYYNKIPIFDLLKGDCKVSWVQVAGVERQMLADASRLDGGVDPCHHLGLRVKGLGLKVWGLDIRASGLGFKVSGLGLTPKPDRAMQLFQNSK